MKKFLNFSTILCSYVLITLLVISCDLIRGGKSSRVDLDDKTCLLADRKDQGAVAAVLCQADNFIGLITKTTPEGQDTQHLDFVIDSFADKDTSTWNLNPSSMIQISYSKDYTVAIDNADSSIDTIAEAADNTAEYSLKNLTIASLLNDSQDDLRLDGISFIPAATGSAIKVTIAVKLAVKTQQDFVNMANFTMPDGALADYPVTFVLVNDLDLIAPGGVANKFTSPIIDEINSVFYFDGGGHKITLKSEINSLNGNPGESSSLGAIIGKTNKATTLQNFTLDINAPISGYKHVASILGQGTTDSFNMISDIKININSNLNIYKGSRIASAGGVVGYGCFDINNVVVKTAEDAAIQYVIDYASFLFSPSLGGLAGVVDCDKDKGFQASIKNNVVDVTLGVFSDTPDRYIPPNRITIGGLVESMRNASVLNNNLVKLAISRVDFTDDSQFYFTSLSGLVNHYVNDTAYLEDTSYLEVKNNLVYADVSNIGLVADISGLITAFSNSHEVNIANNMTFIADGFDLGIVTQDSPFKRGHLLDHFSAVIGAYQTEGSYSSINITNLFVSSPATNEQYDANAKLASFVHTANDDMNFNNLILDNKDAAVMFKDVWYDSTVRDSASTATLSTLAEGPDSEVATILKASDSWEAGSQGYPQLKAPTGLSAANEADWDRVNGLIQEGLAAREARASQ